MTMNFLQDTLIDGAQIIGPDEGEILRIGDSAVQLKLTSEITQDQLGLYQIQLAAGAIGARLHYHRFMDEIFIVNQGIVTLQLGKNEQEVGPGTIVYVPRFTPHGFRNKEEEMAQLTLIFNPAQRREGFFRGLKEILTQEPMDQQQFLQLYHKYDSHPVDSEDAILPQK